MELEKIRSFGAATYKKFLCCELIHHWRELVDENISAKVKPVKIERGILYVDVKSATFRDQLKFLAEERPVAHISRRKLSGKFF